MEKDLNKQMMSNGKQSISPINRHFKKSFISINLT